jgi:hypothetical protein
LTGADDHCDLAVEAHGGAPLRFKVTISLSWPLGKHRSCRCLLRRRRLGYAAR